MQIGELARNAQVNIQTIRFYERQGLLPRPKRSSAGYRCYEAKDLERVIFVKRNQELGFTLEEIAELFQIHEAMGKKLPQPLKRNGLGVQAILTMGRARLRIINEKIRSLHDMRRNLTGVIDHLEKAELATCPVGKIRRKSAKKNLKNSL